MSEQSSGKRRNTAAQANHGARPPYHAEVLSLIESKVEVGPIERLENFLRAEYQTIAGHIDRGHLTITKLAEAVHDSGQFGKPNRQLVSTLWGKIRKEANAHAATEATAGRAPGKPQEKAAQPKKKETPTGTDAMSGAKDAKNAGAEFNKTVGEQQPAPTAGAPKSDK